MEANPNKVVDLASLLNAPTVQVQRPDFDAEPVDETNPDDFNEDDDELGEEGEEQEVEKSYKDYIEDASLFVSLFDSFQTVVLTPVYRSRLLEADDEELISQFRIEQRLIKKGDLAKDAATVDHEVFMAACERQADYKAAIRALPFTAPEKKKLTEPLAKVIHKYQGVSVSPEMALLLSVLMVMAPRIIQVLPESWGNKFSSIATLGLLKNAGTTAE